MENNNMQLDMLEVINDNANNTRAFGRDVARSVMSETRKANKEYQYVPYPELYGYYDPDVMLAACETETNFDVMDAILDGALSEIASSRQIDDFTKDQMTHRFNICKAKSKCLRASLTLNDIAFDKNSREMTALTIRGMSVFHNANSMSPAAWLADVSRRIRFCFATLQTTDSNISRLCAGAAQAKTSPAAAKLFVEAYMERYMFRRQSDENIIKLLKTLLDERKAMANASEPALTVSVPGCENGAFYTVPAAELYVHECISELTDISEIAYIGNSAACAAFKSALSAAKANSFDNIGLDKNGSLKYCFTHTSIVMWAMTEVVKNGDAAGKKEQWTHDAGKKPIARVWFDMPEGISSNSMRESDTMAYTQDGLLAYLSAAVCPAFDSKTIHVELLNTQDKTLANAVREIIG